MLGAQNRRSPQPTFVRAEPGRAHRRHGTSARLLLLSGRRELQWNIVHLEAAALSLLLEPTDLDVFVCSLGMDGGLSVSSLRCLFVALRRGPVA